MKFFDNLKREIITLKTSTEYHRLLKNGRARKFDEDFYKSFDGMYYNALPVNYYLKRMHMGQCYNTSAVLALAMGKDCFVCRGNLANIAYIREEDDFGHGWVEKDGNVYDTTTQVIMSAEDYYRLYGAENITKTKQEIFFEQNKDLSDFEIHDKKYYEENYVPFAVSTVLLTNYSERKILNSLPKNKVEERRECENFLNQFPSLDLMPRIHLEDLSAEQ